MATFSIGIEVGHLIPDGTILGEDVFPRLARAVRAVTETAHGKWQDYAAGAPLPSGKAIENRSGTYLRSIMLRQLSPFSGEVYSDLPYAEAIESGTKARDLKEMLGSSLKVRRTKDGKRYLVIPFRWTGSSSFRGNENAIPASIQNWWRSAAPSHITGHGWRDSGTGALAFRNKVSGTLREAKGETVGVRQRTYSWGARLDADTIRAAGVTGKTAARMEGMVNFRRPGKTGGKSHSQLITFRIMMEGSKGWIAPAREGLWPARTTADEIRPDAERVFAEAVKRDLGAVLSGS